MQYRVLRDCYVGDRFYYEGVVVDLPDDMEKSPKNFQPLDSVPVVPVSPPVETDESSEEPELYISKKDREKMKKNKE